MQNLSKTRQQKKNIQKMGFWTFNKDIKYWEVFDPDWCAKNRVFDLGVLK